MFILSRKSEESVIVDGFNSPKRALKVTVLEVKGGRVKLGFEVSANKVVRRTQAWSRVCSDFGSNSATPGNEAFGS